MMKFYFMKTETGNQIVVTDEKTAKVFDGAPTGIVDDVDLYEKHAVKKFKKVYSELDKSGLLNDYENMGCDFVADYEGVKKDLEEYEAELIYECE